MQNNTDVKDTDKKAKPKESKPKVPAKQAFMYLGPNIPGGRLFTGYLVKEELPENLIHLQDIFEKIPEIKELFVEVKTIPNLKAELNKQGTEAYRLYQAVKSKIQQGVLSNV